CPRRTGGARVSPNHRHTPSVAGRVHGRLPPPPARPWRSKELLSKAPPARGFRERAALGLRSTHRAFHPRISPGRVMTRRVRVSRVDRPQPALCARVSLFETVVAFDRAFHLLCVHTRALARTL